MKKDLNWDEIWSILALIDHKHPAMDLLLVVWRETKEQVEASGGFVSPKQAEDWIQSNWQFIKEEHERRIERIILG